jgi:tubulin-specific chaperone B
MNNLDLLAVRSYVTGRDAHVYDDVSSDTVIIDVTHSNLQQKHIEIRLCKHELLDTLRTKIYRQTGTSPSYQHIQVYTDISRNNLVCEIPVSTPGDTYQIGYFLSQHGMTIHVVDTNPHSISANRALEDTSLVSKFKLTDEEYNQRSNTLRKWTQEQKEIDSSFTLQRHAIRHAALQEAIVCYKRGLPLPVGFIFDTATNQVIRKQQTSSGVANDATTTSTNILNDIYGPESIQHAIIGQRCQIRIGQRRGTIVWTGQLQSHIDDGYWVGIQLDEPTGKNNGTLYGVPYFVVEPNYGAFVRGPHVEVGDFPIRTDIWDEGDDDDSDEEI